MEDALTARDQVLRGTRPGSASVIVGDEGALSQILSAALGSSEAVQVPPAKPGTILLSDEGEWQNTTIFNKECMVRASGSSQDAGTLRAADGHYYWKVVRTWTACEIGDPTQVGQNSAFIKMPFEQVVANDGQCMLDAAHRCFSLVRWVRRAEDGVVCIFENNPRSNPETGWDFAANPAQLLAVSQSEAMPGQHPALAAERQQPPAPPGAPPMV